MKFSDSLSIVDDTSPRRDFLRRCLIDIKENSGIFSSVREGSYTLTHNLEKLLKHDYFSAGRAMAMSLVFGGPAPSFLTESVYSRLAGPPRSKTQCAAIMHHYFHKSASGERICVVSLLPIRMSCDGKYARVLL